MSKYNTFARCGSKECDRFSICERTRIDKNKSPHNLKVYCEKEDYRFFIEVEPVLENKEENN